jgi:hypothetical protein
VATVDHASIGQLCPSDEVGFELIGEGEAVRLLRGVERLLEAAELSA